MTFSNVYIPTDIFAAQLLLIYLLQTSSRFVYFFSTVVILTANSTFAFFDRVLDAQGRDYGSAT